MGITYEICLPTPRDWDYLPSPQFFDDLGLAKQSRWPEYPELTEAAASLEGFELDISLFQIDLQSSSTDAWAIIANTAPAQVKGWPEVIFAVFEKVSRRCGPFVLIGGGRRWLIYPEADFQNSFLKTS
jgi:hypothetical protein